MRVLIIEDELTSRMLLTQFLYEHGQCDVAVDGEEAMEAFSLAWKAGNPYQLICLDMGIPKKDGRAVLQEIRNIEEALKAHGEKKAKIVMITASDDKESILGAFREQCDAYLVKPIDKDKFIGTLKKLGLI